MRRVLLVSALMAGGILAHGAARADSPEFVELRARLANAAIPVEERARRALEGAASLDKAAQQASNASDRQARWSEAVSVLDEFATANPEIESAPVLRFQAGVYRWVEGRNFADRFESSPADSKARAEAIKALDDAIRRLSLIKVKPADNTSVFGQNVRFRLAQAIADRAKFEPDGDPNRTISERQALGLLEPVPMMPGLRSFALLLRSELAGRLGMFGQAQMEVEQAEKLNPAPPAYAILENKAASLIGRGQYDEARKAIDAAKVNDRLKGFLTLRVLLARRREKPPGQERREIDAEALKLADQFRGSNQVEGRRALMELARTIDEPIDNSPPEAWDLLAEGHLRLGDSIRAGRLVGKGSDRAETVGSLEKAASLRYKAGAYLFEAEKYAEADKRLTQVIESKSASKELKARAGMLRALARGRGVATREAGSSRDSYLAALEAQIRDFPNDPNSGEARWLLGQIRLTAGRPDEAIALWSGIPHGHLRWLEARNQIADRLREAVEVQRINRDSAAVGAKMDLARKSLKTVIEQATDGPETVSLTLQLARLELIPETGRAALAIEACERLAKGAARPEEHRVARFLKMVALAQAGRAYEAEQIARAEVKNDDFPNMLTALRLLDRAASETEAEINRKRFGLISRVMTNRMIDQMDNIPSATRDEVHLHHARALLFSGDSAAAKKEIAAWGGPSGPMDDELLRELADTYQRLDASVMAIDAERYRGSRLTPGSLPWFESRYGMALAYYRSDKLKDARQIIDATAILHPDLGGGELRSRFERLRQKLGNE